jgi:hypothetical protein
MPTIRLGAKGHLATWSWLGKIIGAFTGVLPVIEMFKEVMVQNVEKALRRLLGLTVIYFTMLGGVIIMTIGVIFLVIDNTVIPRGMAFMLGGLVLVLGSAFLMQMSKK